MPSSDIVTHKSVRVMGRFRFFNDADKKGVSSKVKFSGDTDDGAITSALVASIQQKVDLLNQELNHPTVVKASAISHLSNLKLEYDLKSEDIYSLKALIKDLNEKLDEKILVLHEEEVKISHQSKLIMTLEDKQGKLAESKQQKVELMDQELYQATLKTESAVTELSELNSEYDLKSGEVYNLEVLIKELNKKLRAASNKQKLKLLNQEPTLVTESAISDLSELHVDCVPKSGERSLEVLVKELNEKLDEKILLLQEVKVKISNQSQLIMTLEDQQAEITASNQQKVELLDQVLNHATLETKSAVGKLSELNLEYDLRSRDVYSLEVLSKELNEKLDGKYMILQETEVKINHQNRLIQALEGQQAELVASSQQKVELLNQELYRLNLATESANSKLTKLSIEDDLKSEKIRRLELQIKEHKEKLEEKTMTLQETEAKINHQSLQILKLEADKARLYSAIYQMQEFGRQEVYKF